MIASIRRSSQSCGPPVPAIMRSGGTGFYFKVPLTVPEEEFYRRRRSCPIYRIRQFSFIFAALDHRKCHGKNLFYSVVPLV
jgi:hypothetical protein